MENGDAVALVDRVDGGAVAPRPGMAAASCSGGSSEAGSGGPPVVGATAARRRTPGRWRRIPRATARNKDKPAATPEPPIGRCEEKEQPPGTDDQLLEQRLREFEEVRKLAPTLTASGWRPAGPLLPEEVQMFRDQWRQNKLWWKDRGTRVIVAPRGSRELAESTEEGNRSMLESAKRLEEEDEDLCDTEEDKVAFRAFKLKFAAVYRRLATTKPEDLVFKYDMKAPASDTLLL